MLAVFRLLVLLILRVLAVFQLFVLEGALLLGVFYAYTEL